MSNGPAEPRSRRALLAAAAGGAAALAASAALPLTAAAAPANMQTELDNLTTATTSITDSGPGSTAFAGHATGTGAGYGLEGTSTGSAGAIGWSVSPPGAGWDPAFTPATLAYTGVFGSAPGGDHVTTYGFGVWGDSPDTGVFGTGTFGVEGYGGVGVAGYAFDAPGTEGVRAQAFSTSSIALRVIGKVRLSRSGRRSMASGTRSKAILLAGTTATSKVFAVLSTNEAGRWVRAVVPAAGKFTILLNANLTSSAVVSWFVLD